MRLPTAVNESASSAAWGQRAEHWACDLLRRQGAEILERNFRQRCGELDVIALHEGVILVVEVRLRRHQNFAGAAASVDRHKQKKILRTTQLWLMKHPEHARLPIRFDVVAIEPTADGRWRRQWLRHAFQV